MTEKELFSMITDITKQYSDEFTSKLNITPKDAQIERKALQISNNVAKLIAHFADSNLKNLRRTAESKFMIPGIYEKNHKLIESQSFIYDKLNEEEKRLLGFYNSFILFSYEAKINEFEEKLKEVSELKNDDEILNYTIKCDVSRKIFERIRKIWSIHGISEIVI